MKLHFILADTLETYIAIVYEGEYIPYKKRIVTIELTDEQKEKIKPRWCGKNCGKDCYEKLIEIIPEGYGEKERDITCN